MTAIQRWLSSLVATAGAVAVSYAWIDRPVALFAHEHLSHYKIFEQLTHIPEPFIPLAVVAFIGLGLWAVSGRPLSKIQTSALICSLSLVMAEATKNQLKFVFGRLWPETWIQNNPSFIRDGAFGFNPFHGGAGYASFPSGHLAVSCGVVSVLWILHPKWRVLYVMAILAVTVGLIGANYHFVSDVIAGAFVGVSTGWMTIEFGKARRAFDA